MQRLLALFHKELLVLSKDLHGLLVLFIMPAIFILIMSLAMRDTFSERHQIEIEYLLIDKEQSEISEEFIENLKQINGFLKKEDEKATSRKELENLIGLDRYKFAVLIPDGFADKMEQLSANGDEIEKIKPLEILVAPSVTPQLQMLFNMTLLDILKGMRLSVVLDDLPKMAGPGSEMDLEKVIKAIDLDSRYIYQGANKKNEQPTSVQQSVPAWLVFAMFFVVIPLSTAFIVERQQGSLLRLRVMNISSFTIIVGKIVPYYAINQVQMILMVMVGVYLVPIFGGDSLEVGHSLFGLFIISSATSLAAISYALLITTLARTNVQATTIGGISNLIFGAIGGIMVPKFVMPPFMRELADISPMSWGLEGYLDLFLRHADWQAVIPEAAALCGFALIALVLASIALSRRL